MKLWCVWDWKSNERKEDRPHTNSYPGSPNVGYSNPHNSVRFPLDNWVITNHNSFFSLVHVRSFYNQFSFPTLSLHTCFWKWEKPQEGGVELCFWKLLRLRSEELFSVSESEVVQSLSEFRVFVQRINVKNKGRKNTSNYTGSFHKPEVVLSPLHFQGEFH